MKVKLLLTISCVVLGMSANAQVILNPTLRTPSFGQPDRIITDKDLRAGKSFWMPYTASTTPVLRTIDSVGSNTQLLSNGNIAVSQGAGQGFFQYIPSSGGSGFVSTVGGSTIAPSTIAVVGLKIRAMASQTGNLLEFRSSADGLIAYFTAAGSLISTVPILTSAGLSNSSGSANSYVSTPTTGTLISRNVADANDALTVNLINATSTGLIADFQAAGSTVASVNKAGNVTSTQYRISTLNTAPASATATGTLGEIRITADFIFICTAANTWKRVAISTW